MKDTTSNMVAPFNPLELTAAQIVGIFIQTHNLELELRQKQEVLNPKYFMPNYHIVSIAPWCIGYAFVWCKNKKKWDLAKQSPHSKSVT